LGMKVNPKANPLYVNSSKASIDAFQLPI